MFGTCVCEVDEYLKKSIISDSVLTRDEVIDHVGTSYSDTSETAPLNFNHTKIHKMNYCYIFCMLFC